MTQPTQQKPGKAPEGITRAPADTPVPFRSGSQSFEYWWQAVGVGAVTLIIGLGVLAAIWFLARPLALFALGSAIAAAFAPIVKWLERWLPRLAAIMALYLVVIIFFVVIGLVVIPPLVEQAQRAVEQIPTLFNMMEGWIAYWDTISQAPLLDLLSGQLGRAADLIVAGPIWFVTSIFEIILIIFISIYLLIEAPRMHHFILSFVPHQRRERVDYVLTGMTNAMGGYVRGTALVAMAVGFLTYIGLSIIGLDFPLVLALVSTVLEVIPYLGPIIATIPIVGAGLLQSPTTALIALIFQIVLQQVESHIILPNIMRTQTEISPLLVMLALIGGAAVGGLLGALVAIPLMAALRVLVHEVIAPAIRRQMGVRQPEKSAGERGAGLP